MKKLVITGLLMAGLAISASANLLSNGGFNGNLDGWNVGGASNSRDWKAADTDGYAYSMENWSADGNNGGSWAYAYQTISITGGKTYDYTAYFTQDDTFNDNGAEAFMEYTWGYGSDTWDPAVKTYTLTDNGEAEVFSFQSMYEGITAPATATELKICIGFENAPEDPLNGSSAFFDAVSVVEAVPEPVSAGLLGLGLAFIYLLRKKVSR